MVAKISMLNLKSKPAKVQVRKTPADLEMLLLLLIGPVAISHHSGGGNVDCARANLNESVNIGRIL